MRDGHSEGVDREREKKNKKTEGLPGEKQVMKKTWGSGLFPEKTAGKRGKGGRAIGRAKVQKGTRKGNGGF